MNWKPLYEKIVVKMSSKQTVVSAGSGLSYVKDLSTSKHTTLKAKVVAVGEGRLMSDGTIVPLKVKVGDTVIFSKMQGDTYADGENEYTILSESNILSIIEED